MKNISTLRLRLIALPLLASLQLFAVPNPTSGTNKTYRDRTQFESNIPNKKYYENFDDYETGEELSYMFDSLVYFNDPKPMVFPGYWDMTGNAGSFSNSALLPIPAFKSTCFKANFRKPVYGVGTNVFDDFDGSSYHNHLTLTATTSKGEIITLSEDSSKVGDCGFLGVTSEDGIVSVTISIDDSDANMEIDLFSVLTMLDSDGDGVADNLDNCASVANADQSDGDCDNTGNLCDLCYGGDDARDTDGDGTPDCVDWEGMATLPADFKCGPANNPKVSICHGGNNQCVASSAVQAKLNGGDFMGPCNASVCSSSIIVDASEFGQPMDLQMDPEKLALDVFPNPSSGDFNIELADATVENTLIVITDAAGKVVVQQKVAPNQLRYAISSNGLPKGMYLVKLFEGGKETSKQDLILL